MKIPPRKDDRLKKWRVEVRRMTGPVGVELLADVLNWNIQRIKPEDFGGSDCRRTLLKNAARANDWRKTLARIQGELQSDVLSILKPTPPSETEQHDDAIVEFYYTMAKESARRVRMRQLVRKLDEMPWRIGLTLDVRAGYRISEAGEEALSQTKFTVDGESFTVAEDKKQGEGNIRGRIYWILYRSLQSGEISRLRICSNPSCNRFYAARRETRKHCSDRCRNQLNNNARRGYFKDNYMKRKKRRINEAKTLLRKDSSRENVQKVLERTGLTYKALERAGIL